MLSALNRISLCVCVWNVDITSTRDHWHFQRKAGQTLYFQITFRYVIHAPPFPHATVEVGYLVYM